MPGGSTSSSGTFLAVERAHCACLHGAALKLEHSQDWVTVDGVPLLVAGDFDGRPIIACMAGAELVGITRCHRVAQVDAAKSHSAFVTIDGRGAALSTAAGTTDWMSAGITPWTMDDPGQTWISIGE